jgi:uncharacterized protein YbbK (DUF523 family)
LRSEKQKDRRTMILVSSCLAGESCRYDGKSCAVKKIEQWVKTGRALTICPEVAGGLGVPRVPCEIQTGADGKRRVVSRTGQDCTDAYIKGAEEALRIVKEMNIAEAVLKSNSPSCGFGRIYDGTFSGTLIEGNGITADLLSRYGVDILNESEIEEVIA